MPRRGPEGPPGPPQDNVDEGGKDWMKTPEQREQEREQAEKFVDRLVGEAIVLEDGMVFREEKKDMGAGETRKIDLGKVENMTYDVRSDVVAFSYGKDDRNKAVRLIPLENKLTDQLEEGDFDRVESVVDALNKAGYNRGQINIPDVFSSPDTKIYKGKDGDQLIENDETNRYSRRLRVLFEEMETRREANREQ